MKVIVAGSRTIFDYDALVSFLDSLPIEITEVVSGSAPGIDSLGERYAKERKLDLTIMPANWERHGKKAGPLRNQRMADYADAAAVLATPGSRGSTDMARRIQDAGKPLFAKRYD